MFDYKMITKESDLKITSLLNEELRRSNIDPFKVTALIELGANGFDRLVDNKTTLQIAVENKMHAVIQVILLNTKDIEDQAAEVWRSFETSNQLHDDHALMVFLNSGVLNVNRKENRRLTALMLAAKNNNLKFAKELLKQKANMHAVDQQNQTVVDYAKMSRNSKMVQFIEHIIKKDNHRKEKQREKLLVN